MLFLCRRLSVCLLLDKLVLSLLIVCFFQMKWSGNEYYINSDDDVNVKYTYDSKKKKKKWLLVIEVALCSDLLFRQYSLSLYGTPFPFLQQ